MIIRFDIQSTKYSIQADGTAYVLVRHGINQKEGENFGKGTEHTLGYYSQVKNAVSRAVQDQLGNSPDEISLSEFILRYEKASDSITQQIGKK